MARRIDSTAPTSVITLTFGREAVDKGFAQADHIFEDTFRFQKVQHYSLEAHNNIAYYDGEKLTVWASCQDPFTLRDHLSGIFGLPLSRIRVIVPYVGGGYGGKLYVKAEPISAALTWMTRRPVKLQLSVNESFKTVTRHPARVTVKTGVTKDGKLIARECQIYMDTGAYADAGPRVTQKAGYRSLGPYKIPYAKVEAYGVYTNTVPAGAFRGFGALQVTWAYESQMDMIADRLGLDPLDFRLKNLLKKGDLYTVGDTPVDCDMSEGLLKVADRIKWRETSDQPNRAKGISCCIKDGGGTYKVAGATVKMSSDGSVVLLIRNGGTRPGPKHGIDPGSRRRAFHAPGTDHRRPTRYRCDAVRHLHQRQQFDGGYGHRGPARRAGRKETIASMRRQDSQAESR